VRGAAQASLQAGDVELILVGETARVGRVLADCRHDAERLRIHHASEVVRGGERAAEALAARPEATIAVAVGLVADREADAVITCGPPAAALLACKQRWRTIPGVRAPALSGVFPTEMRRGAKDDPFALILDIGAHGDATSDELVQFALMGATYASKIARNARPRVALVAGSEAGGAPREVERAGDKLLRQTGVNYVGGLSAIDIPRGAADVVVCSGYVGHTVMSLLGGVVDTVLSLARYASKDRLLWRAATGLITSGAGRVRRLTDWPEYGGAPVLGYEHLLLRLSSTSGAASVLNAIKICSKAVERGVAADIGARIAEVSTRPVPAAV
jgi:glycerol-3-phosphate acyltransferase PlsX